MRRQWFPILLVLAIAFQSVIFPWPLAAQELDDVSDAEACGYGDLRRELEAVLAKWPEESDVQRLFARVQSNATTPDLQALPLAAASFDTAASLAPSEASVNRNDFWKIAAFLLSPGTFEEDDEKVSIEVGGWGFLQNLKSTVIAREPLVREDLVEALDEEQEAALVENVDLSDDVTIELDWRIWPRQRRPVAGLMEEYLTAEWNIHEPEIEFSINEKIKEEYALLHAPRLRHLQDAMDCLRNQEGLETELRELTELGREYRQRLGTTFQRSDEYEPFVRRIEQLTRDAGPQLVKIHQANLNRPQLHLSGRSRWSEPSTAQEERGVSATFQIGFPRIRNGNVAELKKITDRDHAPHAFALKASWTEKDEAVLVEYPDFTLPSFEQIGVAANWTTKIAKGALPAINGIRLGADQSLTISYIQPRGGEAEERFLIEEKLVFHLTDAISVPISLVYANRQEFVKADHVEGRFGFSFSFDNAGAKAQ
jgi:hypothetical protein